MTIDELCDAVNAALVDAGIEVSDGRTTAVVTPRNVRYYRSIGLVSPPAREGGRSAYSQVHLAEIVELKRAQARGVKLEDLGALRRSATGELAGRLEHAPLSAHAPMMRSVLTTTMPMVRPTTAEYGWSVRVGEITISGFGAPPAPHQLDAIAAVLEVGVEHDQVDEVDEVDEVDD